MRLHPRRTTFAVAASALALIGTTVAPAQAGLGPETVADGLITPLSVAVADDGTVYVSQNFAGMLTRIPSGGGDPEEVFTHPDGDEVGAVSATNSGVVFATTGGTRRDPAADLWSITGDGDPVRLANLYRYEKRNNPDADRTYGLLRAGKSCLKKVPPFVRPYHGIVESHPYATALGDGVVYVADAAGNSVLAVDETGVSTVATLPATKIEITRRLKREYDLPRCVIGKTYRAEGVPTDVEIGPEGDLFVTSLPGAPGEGLPVGRIYRFDPSDGSRTLYSRGLVSPTGLAFGADDTAYVAQLFAGSIVAIPVDGETTTFAEVPFVGDVEFSDGSLYATETDLTNDGSSPPAGKVLRWGIGPMR